MFLMRHSPEGHWLLSARVARVARAAPARRLAWGRRPAPSPRVIEGVGAAEHPGPRMHRPHSHILLLFFNTLRHVFYYGLCNSNAHDKFRKPNQGDKDREDSIMSTVVKIIATNKPAKVTLYDPTNGTSEITLDAGAEHIVNLNDSASVAVAPIEGE